MEDRKQEGSPGRERDPRDVGEATNGLLTDNAQAECYATETVANSNVPATAEQIREHESHNNNITNWVESSNVGMAADHYDPMEEQVHYYQDEEGNYYCYTTPQLEVENEMYDSAREHDTRKNFSRYYEYNNWKPHRYGFLIDIIVYAFLSKAFKLYLTLLLYSAGVLITLTGLNYTFSVVYLIYNPPSKSKRVMQVLCYLSMFFYLTFAIVNVICVMLDMLTNLWRQKLDDVQLWGMSHVAISKQKPPYFVYFAILIATVVLPFFWSIVDAASDGKTALYWIQCYAAIAVIVTVFIVMLCYVWFYWRSLMYKSSAIRKYKERDEFPSREEAYKHHPEKMRKTHWYHAQTILEEFGLDKISVRCDSIVFTLGCVPLFAMCAVQALSTYTGDPSVLWGVIGSLALVCIYTVVWLSLFHRKNHLYIYMVLFLNILFLVLGIIGGLSTANPSMAGVVFLLWIVSQYMLTRRRTHSLSNKELRTMLGIPPDYRAEEDKQKIRIDSYLLCCSDFVLDYIGPLKKKMHFRHKHPDVRDAEESRTIARVAMRCDQKVLLVWWLFVLFAVAFVIGIGNSVRYLPKDNIALIANTKQTGTDPNSFLCQVIYNDKGTAPLKLYDLALLSALSFTYSTSGDNDFATWFSHRQDFTRVYPKKLPPTLNYETDGTSIRYSVYNDKSSNFYVVTLNSNSRGLSIFRNMNDWGESIVLRVAEAITPFVSLWPDSYKKRFVQKSKFFKDWLPRSGELDGVRKAIEIIRGVPKTSILLLGEQFNGGYVKLLSAEYGVPFLSFNSPGTRYKLSSMLSGTQVSGVRGLWSYVDSLDDSDVVMHYPCGDSHSMSHCSRITTAINYIYNLCGDPYKRTVQNI